MSFPTASAYVETYVVPCPACDSPLCDPRTASQVVGRDSVDALAAIGRQRGYPTGVVECFECGTLFRLPAAVRRLAS